MAEKMTKEVQALLKFLSGRGITFLMEKDLPAAHQAHDNGWIAINRNAAMITPAGRRALDEATHDRCAK